MSVLSSPQGSPERVWSLVAGLSALGGETDRQTFDSLLNPGFLKDGIEQRANANLAANALGAASSLGLVDAARDRATIAQDLQCGTIEALADHVHDRLSGLQSGSTDAAILEAYAWICAECDRQGGMGWIYDLTRDQFADQANAALIGEDEDGRLINTTKLPAWHRWLAFLGLDAPLPVTKAKDFPSPTVRLRREIQRAGHALGAEIAAADFAAFVARRMPYLDGGRLFNQACQRIGHAPNQRRFSPMLSNALRDLHDDGIIVLQLSGDSSTHLRLIEDVAHPVDAFTTVEMRTLEAS